MKIIIFLLLFCKVNIFSDGTFCKLNIKEEIPYLYQLIKVESEFKSDVISFKNAVGIMQITDVVLEDYYTFKGIKYELHEMSNNYKCMEVGIWQLKRLKKYFKCDVLTVSSYNMGIGNTENNILNKDFVIKILGKQVFEEWAKNKKISKIKGNPRLIKFSF